MAQMQQGNKRNENAELLLQEAIKLTEEGNYDRAIEIYNKLIPYEIPEVFNNLGNIYRRQGLLGRAIEMYRRAIQLYPNFPIAYFNLACALMEVDKYNEAVMFFEKAEKLGLKSFDLDVQLALCYIALGNKKKAKEKLSDERVKSEVEKYVEGGLEL
ncbi:tetratricopeptide repeat protein [Fervidobacterium pennivorans]|uniref:tetratricopeptide repeat protein n=1 Tax=Fervidobacterium pennivorans TaxID=93466 RepID=UPI0014369467|nr:tetratricopeptide repeat protein [Fervidobacterium pennivorans]QIV78257.1 tetratricopeptide repeat protein [Fervidobacterium pennivorans subsp. keratinolyticus]